jgi:large subunit ribosomal protein L25
MKSVSISGSPRANVGTKDAKALRAEGKIPCVLYGGTEQVHFSALEKDFKPLVYTPEVKLADLNIDGRTFKATMKEVQFHPISDKLLHVDFLEVSDAKPVIIEVPVKVVGNSPGIKAGGKLVTKFRKLKIRSALANLPESITVNIDKLEIGDGVRVKDITLNGVTLLNTPNAVVVSVATTRNVAAAAQESAKK